MPRASPSARPGARVAATSPIRIIDRACASSWPTVHPSRPAHPQRSGSRGHSPTLASSTPDEPALLRCPWRANQHASTGPRAALERASSASARKPNRTTCPPAPPTPTATPPAPDHCRFQLTHPGLSSHPLTSLSSTECPARVNRDRRTFSFACRTRATVPVSSSVGRNFQSAGSSSVTIQSQIRAPPRATRCALPFLPPGGLRQA